MIQVAWIARINNFLFGRHVTLMIIQWIISIISKQELFVDVYLIMASVKGRKGIKLLFNYIASDYNKWLLLNFIVVTAVCMHVGQIFKGN